jgi:hypothetical protein
MGVFVEKPDKLRARAVICGNFVDRNAGEAATFTEQVDVTSVRLLLRQAALQDWQISSLDVSVAFLNAELSPEDLARGISCRPPKIFVDAGICMPEQIWVIKKALYGLRQAPRAWGTHRDAALAALVFKATDGSELRLNQLRTDPCVWQILRTDVQGTGGVGWVAAPARGSGDQARHRVHLPARTKAILEIHEGDKRTQGLPQRFLRGFVPLRRLPNAGATWLFDPQGILCGTRRGHIGGVIRVKEGADRKRQIARANFGPREAMLAGRIEDSRVVMVLVNQQQ